ncbi:MAG TPA: 50S ribosomal protein L32 [Atopostipes sp.]|nr:50S ribosomal protein L32 [Atopostipes sp.]
MAVPKRRTSKSKKLKRRTHQKLAIPNLSECSNCGELRKSHHVCSSCGHYDGKEVVEA